MSSFESPHLASFAARTPSFAQDGDVVRAQDALKRSERLEQYVEGKWDDLRCGLKELYLGRGSESKVRGGSDLRLYISAREDAARVGSELADARAQALSQVGGDATKLRDIRLVQLSSGAIPEDGHGLLYLPHPYIIPGGRFAEMYGWDSAFIADGLWQKGHVDDVKHIQDNFLYEIEYYGTVLNGNRTYYSGRSQPPLYTDKILPIFEQWDSLAAAAKGSETAEQWLTRAATDMEEYYKHWTTPPRIDSRTGLSLYSSFNNAPLPEVTHGESQHYEGAREYFAQMQARQQALKGEPRPQDQYERYLLDQFYDAKKDALTPAFYRGDHAMRESGFDPCERFGPYNVDIIHYAPVCLNSLRFKMEGDMAAIAERLKEVSHGRKDAVQEKLWSKKAREWKDRANITKMLINNYLWDDGKENGVQVRDPAYRDRHIDPTLREKYNLPVFRDYPFATSLYPLWVGAAPPERAAESLAYVKDEQHRGHKLLTRFGIRSSANEDSGCQWDNMHWAPLNVAAVHGLERSGFDRDALTIAVNFLNAQADDFDRTGKLHEKLGPKGSARIYNPDAGPDAKPASCAKGYQENVEGFGWTNSAIIDMRATIKRILERMQSRSQAAPQYGTRLRTRGNGHTGFEM